VTQFEEKLLKENARLTREVETLQGVVSKLNEELKLAIAAKFGRKSERADSPHNQEVIEAFEQDSNVAQSSDAEAQRQKEAAKEPEKPRRKSRPKPQLKPEAPVREERVVLEAPDPVCPVCSAQKVTIRREETEEIDFVPAHFVRRIYERPICACPNCKEQVTQAMLPDRPIDKSIAGAGLLAHIVVSKTEDHLPLYRQEKIFERHGLQLSRATMNNWMEKCAFWGQPVAKAQLKEILASGYIQVDETPVKVLDPQRPGKASQAWLWVICNPQVGVYFHFATGRGSEDIKEILEGYEGILQTDGYAVYETLFKLGILNPKKVTHVGCWAHARREFWKADTVGQSEKAGEIIALIQQLYRIEKQLADKRDNDRKAVRQIKALPVLEKIKSQIEAYQRDPKTLPARQLSKACAYVLKRWDELTAYCHNGCIRIDNNPVENKIRPAALGRKNWLFIGHPTAGWRTGVFYTLMANCSVHKVNPFHYMRDFLKAVPTEKNKQIVNWLPGRYEGSVKELSAQR
jgi:transposase